MQDQICESHIRFGLYLALETIIQQSLGVLCCCEGSVRLMEADEIGQEGTDYLVLIKLLLQSLFAFMIESLSHYVTPVICFFHCQCQQNKLFQKIYLSVTPGGHSQGSLQENSIFVPFLFLRCLMKQG